MTFRIYFTVLTVAYMHARYVTVCANTFFFKSIQCSLNFSKAYLISVKMLLFVNYSAIGHFKTGFPFFHFTVLKKWSL